MAKLVRDGIIDIIRANGEEPNYHEASHAEYGRMLPAKLQEEVTEFLENPSVEELGDIAQVIKAIEKFYGWDLEAARQKKEQERGGFEKRYILE